MKLKKHRSNSKLKFIAGIICWGLYMVVFVVLDVLLAWIGRFFEKRKQEE